MTWTYSGDPASSTKDAVRFLVGDTSEDAPELSDEEVLWLLASEGGVERAAARGAEALASKNASLIDKSIGAASISASQRFEHYRQLASRLWASATTLVAVPWAGGINESDKSAQESDPTRIAPAFSRDMMEYPDIEPVGDDG
jgi:hypothetical protein